MPRGGVAKLYLRWALTTWLENHGQSGWQHIPPHDCWFTTKPDAGYCPFHEQWFDAASCCDLIDEWAAADEEPQ